MNNNKEFFKDGEIVVISRKKKNGYPFDFKIGEKAKVITPSGGVEISKRKYLIKSIDDERFKTNTIHFSFLMNKDKYIRKNRKKKIKEIKSN